MTMTSKKQNGVSSGIYSVFRAVTCSMRHCKLIHFYVPKKNLPRFSELFRQQMSLNITILKSFWTVFARAVANISVALVHLGIFNTTQYLPLGVYEVSLFS